MPISRMNALFADTRCTGQTCARQCTTNQSYPRSFFSKPPADKEDSTPSPGGQFVYEEDWGEKYDGVSILFFTLGFGLTCILCKGLNNQR